MKRFFFTFIIFTSIAALSACSTSHEGKHSGRAAPAQILYSPTGDPLNGGPLGRPTCQEAMKLWFARVDANHDGSITQDEFLADARTQFQRMDIDKNGYLVSEEVERFRMPYRESPPGRPSVPASDQETPQPAAKQHGGRHGGGGRSGGGDSGGSAAGGNIESGVIDPVMSADTNLDYRVTPDEFMAYTQKKFTELDSDHNGTLSQTEVLTLCGQKQ